ncbi:hypothetical protein ABZT49_14215 [Methylobacterium sp. EM32]|uniref:hypothetical protein n=1 Tax=Methylobacterium sp. EM32 TaxID=3163481 RepID=UPI00339E30BD
MASRERSVATAGFAFPVCRSTPPVFEQGFGVAGAGRPRSAGATSGEMDAGSSTDIRLAAGPGLHEAGEGHGDFRAFSDEVDTGSSKKMRQNKHLESFAIAARS